MKKLLSLIALLVIFTGCHGGSHVDRAQSFVNLLNAQHGSHFVMVKHPAHTYTEGFVVVWSASTGYVAYDMAYYRVGDSWFTYSNRAEYQEVYINRREYDPWTGDYIYYGHTYYNNFWGSYAGYFAFEETEGEAKDLEKFAAFQEAYKVGKLSEALASEFGLSEERSLKVAKLVNQWEGLGKGRALTDADAHAFSKELLGVDMAQAASAIERKLAGDDSLYGELLETAAQVNGTTPEQMNLVITDLLARQ